MPVAVVLYSMADSDAAEVNTPDAVAGLIVLPLITSEVGFLISANLARYCEERLAMSGTTRIIFCLLLPSSLVIFSLQRIVSNGRTVPALMLAAVPSCEKMSYLLASPPSISAL